MIQLGSHGELEIAIDHESVAFLCLARDKSDLSA
jgi:hypothetical protein